MDGLSHYWSKGKNAGNLWVYPQVDPIPMVIFNSYLYVYQRVTMEHSDTREIIVAPLSNCSVCVSHPGAVVPGSVLGEGLYFFIHWKSHEVWRCLNTWKKISLASVTSLSLFFSWCFLFSKSSFELLESMLITTIGWFSPYLLLTKWFQLIGWLNHVKSNFIIFQSQFMALSPASEKPARWATLRHPKMMPNEPWNCVPTGAGWKWWGKSIQNDDFMGDFQGV